MDKYKIETKFLETKDCTYYTAFDKVTLNRVTIKKIRTRRNWEELLESSEIIFMKNMAKNKRFLAKIIEIIRENNRFYIIHQQLNNNLVMKQVNDKFDNHEILNIGLQIMKILKQLLSQTNIPIVTLKTQLFFYHNKIVKLGHLLSPVDSINFKLYAKFQEDYTYYPPQKLRLKEEFALDEKSHLFTIGLIMCQLIINDKLINVNNRRNYIRELNRLFPSQKINSILAEQEDDDNDEEVSFVSRMEKLKVETEIINLLSMILSVDINDRISLEEAILRTDSLLKNKNVLARSNSIIKNQKINEINNDSQILQSHKTININSQLQGQQSMTIHFDQIDQKKISQRIGQQIYQWSSKPKQFSINEFQSTATIIEKVDPKIESNPKQKNNEQQVAQFHRTMINPKNEFIRTHSLVNNKNKKLNDNLVGDKTPHFCRKKIERKSENKFEMIIPILFSKSCQKYNKPCNITTKTTNRFQNKLKTQIQKATRYNSNNLKNMTTISKFFQ